MFTRILKSIIDLISIVIHPLSKITSKNRIKILCYHRVYELKTRTSPGMNIMSVTPEAFEAQMAFLAGHNYHVITLCELSLILHQKRQLPENTVVITFDDGYRDNYLNAKPVLDRYGLKGTFFLVTDYIDKNGIFSWLKLDEYLQKECENNKNYWLPMSSQEIRDIVNDKKHCIGSHTCSHADLNRLAREDTQAVNKELRDSLQQIGRFNGDSAKCFCYPFGYVSNEVVTYVIDAGYDIAVCSAGGSNHKEGNPYLLKRITIEGDDNIGRFTRKINGAYDWWYGGLLPFLRRQ